MPIKYRGPREIDANIIIGDDTWIAKNAVIIGNITIGKHCVIGANSVVTTNIPDFSIAVGAPAKVVKQYDFAKKILGKNIGVKL